MIRLTYSLLCTLVLFFAFEKEAAAEWLSQTAPMATVTNFESKKYVFAVGESTGRVYCRYETTPGGSWAWADLGKPSSTNISNGTPLSGIAYTFSGTNMISVFARGDDLNLWELVWNGSSWSWMPHGQPQGTSVATGPSAIFYGSTPTIDVYLFGTNNHLYLKQFGGLLWNWYDLGVPSNPPSLWSDPHVFRDSTNGDIIVVAVGNGSLYVDKYVTTSGVWTWTNEAPGNLRLERPSGVFSAAQDRRIYAAAQSGDLMLQRVFPGGFVLAQLGHPQGATAVYFSCAVTGGGSTRAWSRTDDGRLARYNEDIEGGYFKRWDATDAPAAVSMTGPPACQFSTPTQESTFQVSSTGRLYQRVGLGTWIPHGNP